MEIKVEQSKPLTKQQKEQRRRRNKKEYEKTDWTHLHYRPGKGFMRHCEHTKLIYTEDTENRTEKNRNENSELDINTKNTNEVLDRYDNNSDHGKTTTITKENEVEPVTDDGQQVNQQNDVVKNTETIPSNEQSSVNQNNIIEDIDVMNPNNNKPSQTTLTATTDRTLTPASMNSVTPPAVNTNNESNNARCNKLERDAVSGLLLLSGSEDTMDEFDIPEDENHQVEFTEEIDGDYDDSIAHRSPYPWCIQKRKHRLNKHKLN